MTRAPFNVLAYPYRKVDHDEFEYALLKLELGFASLNPTYSH